MVAIQIRDVPDEIRDVLAERAARENKSLQAYLLDVVVAHARHPMEVDFDRLAHLRAGISSKVDIDMIVDIIREGREGRDEDLAA